MQSSLPLISVIIPAYNTQDYLPRCLDSLLCQTLPDFELLLIDDGSTDGTAAVADRYAEADSRVKVIRKENGGVSSARNRGLEVARGEFITFVDSDDMVAPTYLETLHRALCENRADISLVAHIKDFPSQKYFIQYASKRLYTQNEIDKIGLLSNSCMHMFRRSSMTVFRFDENIRYGEDLLFTMQNFYGSPGMLLATSPEYLYTYDRGNPVAATLQDFRPDRMSEVEALHRIQDLVREYPSVLNVVNGYLSRIVWNLYYELLAAGGSALYPTEANILRSEFLKYRKLVTKGLPLRSRLIPGICVCSERMGRWVIQKKACSNEKEKVKGKT